MKYFWITCISTLLALATSAQSSDCEALQAVTGGGGALTDLLSGSDKVTKVCVVSESDEHITLRVEYTGFSNKDYKIVAKILNASRKPLGEFEEQNVPLSKTGNTADLHYEFRRKSANYSQPHLDSRFLSVIVTEKDDPLTGLDLQGVSIFGTAYLYKLERRWRVGGGAASNIVVTVKLTPFKSASTIKP